MAETGILPPERRVELLDGKIIDMSPIGSFHASKVKRLSRLFTLKANERWIVSSQDPIHLDDHSEPQPDLVLLKPSPDDYAGGHGQPEDVYLLIEVSDSTLHYDREKKLPAYGRAGIPEVWIVNLIEAGLEVYREPHFTGYGSKTVLHPGDQIAPQAFPDVVVDVAELLKR
jgi:Uma2 family endonuclease